MKQTSVDFLVKGLPMVYWEDPYYSHLLEQAKEIEKQQIIDAYHYGFGSMLIVPRREYNPEEYYNEIFIK